MARRTKGKPEQSQSAGLSLVVPPVPSTVPLTKPAGGASDLGAAPSSQPAKLELVAKVNRADIDRLGKVSAVLADWKVQAAPYEKEKTVLENRINGAVEYLGAEEIYPDEANEFRLMVGARAEQQQLVDGALVKVLGFLGQDKFLAIAGVTFTALEKALTAEQYAQVVTKSRTGKRTITVVAKAAPAPLKPAA